MHAIDGTRIKEWLICPRLPYLSARKEPARATTPLSETIFSIGREVEARLLAKLAPSEVSFPAGDLRAGFSATRALLDARTPLIAGSVLIDGDHVGRPDLLEWNVSTQAYEVADIKAAEEATAGARLQVAFYARMLASFAPTSGTGHVILFNGERVTFALDTVSASLDHLIARIHAGRAGSGPTPRRIEACDECRYHDACVPNLIARHDLSLVPELSRAQAEALNAAGIADLPSLLAADVELASAASGLSPDLVRRLSTVAAAVQKGIAVRLAPPRPEVAASQYALAAITSGHHGRPLAIAGVVIDDPSRFRARFLREPEVASARTELANLINNLDRTKGPILCFGSAPMVVLDHAEPDTASASALARVRLRLVDLRAELRRGAALPGPDRTLAQAAKSLGLDPGDPTLNLEVFRYLRGGDHASRDAVPALLRRDLGLLVAIRAWLLETR